MIKLLFPDAPPALLDLSPGDTTDSINQRWATALGTSFEISIQETITGRFLPRDEPIFDNREYYVSFTRLPSE
jgi:hypothetical protein